MNLDQLLEQSNQFDQDKNDYITSTDELTFFQDKMMIADSLFNAGLTLGINDNALQQICNKLGPPPFSYMKACPNDLRADNLNYWRSQLGKNWLVRTYQDNARAVLSTEYTPIMNTRVIEMVRDIIGNTPYRIARPYVDPDTLHIRILVADDQGGRHAVGAYVGNGETGQQQVRVAPLIQRTSCDNSIIMVAQGWAQRHIYVSPAYIHGSIKEHLGQALKIATDTLNNVVEAEMDNIPNFGDVVTAIAKDKGLLEYRDLIIMGSETDQTRMGLVNGLSFAARDAEQEHAIVMESLAGEYLTNRRVR
jgi:hypothetical protein